MPNLSFIALVVATLVCSTDEEMDSAGDRQADGTGWAGAADLNATVRSRFRGDPTAERLLDAAPRDPTAQHSIDGLAAAVERYAVRDPEFLANLRQLVVDAYADPNTAWRLPDPSPHLGAE